MRGVNDIRQTEIHRAQPLVTEPTAFQFELDIDKLKRHKLPGVDRISTKWHKPRCRIILSVTHKVLNFTGNKTR